MMPTYILLSTLTPEGRQTLLHYHLSVSLGSRGTVNIVTLPAIPTSELRNKLKEGGHLGP